MRKYIFVTTRDGGCGVPADSVECFVKEKDKAAFVEFFCRERKDGNFNIQLFDGGINTGYRRKQENGNL